jgi:hypothetical protein
VRYIQHFQLAYYQQVQRRVLYGQQHIFSCHWILIMSNLEVNPYLIHITSLKQGGREAPQNISDTSLC